MREIENFQKGMGIGGWLSNYKRFHVLPREQWEVLTAGDMEHFREYITEKDVAYIASLGMDHVRLCFDQIVLEERPYVYRAEILGILHRFVCWCKNAGLRVVFNLHKAVGNYCDRPEETGLMQNGELQSRFIALWLRLEQEFSGDDSIFFELLNEVTNASPEEWNALAEKTVQAIRRVNRERVLIVGGTDWNNPPGLEKLHLFEDDKVLYTFHCYAPFEFTHQQGVLQPGPMLYNRKMPYPTDDMERYRDYYRCQGIAGAYSGRDRMDISFLREYLSPAIEFVRKNPSKVLWCGEFGTIRHCPMAYRENWMRDMITVLKENHMPYCVWNYLSTPNDGNRFSLVDDDTRQILSPAMARIIRGDI